MAFLLTDSMDFTAYERETECKAKVRRASKWEEELFAQFAPEGEIARLPTMGSTKLRDLIDFRPGEVTCWAGYSGHRKSMFLGQAVLDFSAAGYRTLLASFEMLPRMTLARMARQTFACERTTRQEIGRAHV